MSLGRSGGWNGQWTALYATSRKKALPAFFSTNVISWRPVAVKRLDDDGARITGDIKPGERIVALGAHLLREGEQVRVADRPATVAAEGARP